MQEITADFFAAEYEAHAGALETYLLRMTRDEALAADLVQSAFMAAWESREKFSGKSKFKTWVFSIGINMAREHFRRKKPVYVEEYTHEPTTEGDCPNEALIQSEMLEHLQEAIAALPDDLREVLELIRFQEMSYADAAEALGATVATVRMRLHRAMQQLVSQFESVRD